MDDRQCSRCGESRPVSEFYVQDKETGRLNPWCKQCYKDWYRDRGGYRTPPTEKRCEQCGEVFVGRGNKRFCGAACKAKASHARRHPQPERMCPTCGATFTSSRKTYCSHECSERARAADGRGAAARRRHLLKKKYGLTEAAFAELLARQGGNCAICGSAKPNAQHDQWQIDHCHTTGKVRGVLCGPCNAAIGHMRDDPKRLRAAADYIERHRT